MRARIGPCPCPSDSTRCKGVDGGSYCPLGDGNYAQSQAGSTEGDGWRMVDEVSVKPHRSLTISQHQQHMDQI